MAGRSRYSQQDKDRALAALMASAAQRGDGTLMPQFRPVGRSLGIGQKSLRRWWGERDRTLDAALCRAKTHARIASRANGAETWIEDCVGRIKEGVSWVVAEERRTDDARPDQIARALKDIVFVVKQVDDLTKTDTTASPEGRMDSLRKAAAQVGLTGGKK